MGPLTAWSPANNWLFKFSLFTVNMLVSFLIPLLTFFENINFNSSR
jgi:hypothetical protein